MMFRRYLPQGNTLDEEAWRHRHRIVLAVLTIHIPALFVFGLVLGHPVLVVAEVVTVPLLLAILAHVIPTKHRRLASISATAGLTWCSVSLVGFSHGTIEAHFHFFIIIGFIALYQDWAPFLWNIVFTSVSHGLGSLLYPTLIFNHHAGQANPWLWSGIHGTAVAFACVGIVLFWRVAEDDQRRVYRALADAEVARRQFTSDLLVNLARRNQKMLYPQLEIINQLEHKERDPDVLAELFRLEHLVTRARRNAESLLVLSGEANSRVWSAPVPLREVVLAAIAETEDLDRVTFSVDERLAVTGNSAADLTHLLAELTENAVHFSPPETAVSIVSRPYPQLPGAQLVTVEDFGLGMPAHAMAAANELLSTAPDMDLSESHRLGFHVVARLAKKHGLTVSLTPTPGCGATAAVVLPPELFGPSNTVPSGSHAHHGSGRLPRPALAMGTAVESQARHASAMMETNGLPRTELNQQWSGWWGPHEDGMNGVGLRLKRGDGDRVLKIGAGSGSPEGEPQGRQSAPAESTPPATLDGHSGVADPPTQAEHAQPRLTRRRPQTHLTPELRHPIPRPRHASDAPPEAPPPAADALSSYQASRRAAQAAAEQRDGEYEQRQQRRL